MLQKSKTMLRITIVLLLIFTCLSCKKNKENIIERELGESIHRISSDLNTLLFSHALVDKFCNQEFYDQEDCFFVESDTTLGVVTHTIHFEKENFCDFYSDSTSGTIQVRFDVNYGAILDTVLLNYIHFKSNGHEFNGQMKVIFLSNVNFTTTLQKLIISDLDVTYKNETYNLVGEFSTLLSEQKYKSTGQLSSSFFGKTVKVEIINALLQEGNYSWTQPYSSPYFLGGMVDFKIGSETFKTHYGVNSQSFVDYSKAVCIDSTGYRYILSLSKL